MGKSIFIVRIVIATRLLIKLNIQLYANFAELQHVKIVFFKIIKGHLAETRMILDLDFGPLVVRMGLRIVPDAKQEHRKMKVVII